MIKGKIRRVIAAALALITLMCLFAVPVNAAGKGDIVLVGACADFGISKAGGEYFGYAYDYCKELEKRTGMRFSYVEASAAELMDMLAAGKIDALACVGDSDMRYNSSEDINRGNISLGVKYSAVYVTKNNGIDFYDTKTLSKKKIGYLAENYGKYFKDGAFICGEIADANFVQYNSESQMYSDFVSGKVDAVVKECFRPWDNEELVYQFNTENFYFCTSNNDKDLLTLLDETAAAIFVSNSRFLSNLYETHLARYGMTEYAYSAAEKKFISSHEEISIAYNMQSSMLELYDSSSGKLVGATAEILNKIEQYSRMKINIVPCKSLPECVEKLKSGEVLAVCGGVNNESMSSYGAFTVSIPYIRVPVAIAGLPETTLADHMKAAVPNNSDEIRSHIKRLYPNTTFVPFENVKKCFEAVKSGEADMVCAGAYEIVNLVNSGETNLKLLKVDSSSQGECFAYSGSTPEELITIFGKCLAKISNNESLVSSYSNVVTNGYDSLTANRFADKYFYIILGAIILMVAGVGVSIAMILVRSQRSLDTDPLTGGRTKNKFIADAARLMKKSGDKWAMMIFDIDKFKYVNDRLGYEEGNRILERIYKTLSDKMESDELFARLNDDNFACLVHNAGDNELNTRFSAIFAEFDRRNAVFVNYPIVFSAGICRMGQCIENGVTDINVALDRCQIAKRTLKGVHYTSIAFYDGKIRENALREKDFENIMPLALERHEFECYLQPKYGLISRRIEGAEALIRWNSKEFGFVCPGDFIPLSEKNGFVVELDFFILEEVCKAMRRWIDSGKTPVVVSVNQSRLHLNDDDYIWRLREIVDKYDIPYKYIELELTESVFTENAEKLLQIMHKLHDIGFKLSLDDFGSGYSSLNMLKDIPVDVVKIDREFFNGTVNSQKGRAVISTVVDLASKLNMNVISEGVETREQVEYLTDIHCDMVQGYYFAKPMKIHEFEERWFGEMEADKQDENNVG